jgi:signal transduction histidine kinase
LYFFDLEIYVKDTGIGISKEKLFSMFKIEKVQSTKGTNEESGTGLGLILCKDLLELNDGEIMVDSQLNLGTTFTITLPVKKNLND